MRKRITVALVVGVLGVAALWFGRRLGTPTPAAHSDTSAGTLITDTPHLDLGRLPPGREVAVRFVVRNAGDRPARVASIRQSCGCAPASLRTMEFSPGQAEEVVINYRVQPTLGRVTQAVWLQTADPGAPEIPLTFTTQVEWSVEASPIYVAIGHHAPGEVTERQIKLLANDGRRFAVTGVTAPSFVKVVRASGEPSDTCHRYDVSVTAPTRATEYNEKIRFLTDHPDRSAIELPLTGTVGGVTGCIPPRLLLSGKPGETIPASVSIPNPAGAKVVGVSVTDKGWEVIGREVVPEADRVKLALNLRSPPVGGYVRTTLRVEFDGSTPPAEVPLSCYLAE